MSEDLIFLCILFGFLALVVLCITASCMWAKYIDAKFPEPQINYEDDY